MRYGFYLIVAVLSLMAGWYAMEWYDSPTLVSSSGVSTSDSGFRDAPSLDSPPGDEIVRLSDDKSLGDKIPSDKIPGDEILGDSDISNNIPRFDIVRVAPDGSAVIAGRSAPSSRIVLYDGEDVLGEVSSDERGEWVFVPDAQLSGGTMTLSLRSYEEDGRVFYSTDDVTIAIPERRGKARLDQAVVLAQDGEAGLRVLQIPSPDGLTGISLDRIEYPNTKEVIYGGTAPAGAILRVYLDHKMLDDVRADEEGRWHIRTEFDLQARGGAASPTMGRGILRLDRLVDQGRVQERIEVPFTRLSEDETRIDPGQEYIVVGSGNSLWRIARRYYGEGIAYQKIYQANSDVIKDPDMIYPGQAFSTPLNAP